MVNITEWASDPKVQQMLKDIDDDGNISIGTPLPEGFVWTEDKKAELAAVLQKYRPTAVDLDTISE